MSADVVESMASSFAELEHDVLCIVPLIQWLAALHPKPFLFVLEKDAEDRSKARGVDTIKDMMMVGWRKRHV